MELTPAERIELVEELWDSIELEQLPPLAPEEIAELKRELAEHKADPSDAQRWETVREWLWSRRK
jgi:putative addiction module component (TIGR02574 family)